MNVEGGEHDLVGLVGLLERVHGDAVGQQHIGGADQRHRARRDRRRNPGPAPRPCPPTRTAAGCCPPLRRSSPRPDPDSRCGCCAGARMNDRSTPAGGNSPIVAGPSVRIRLSLREAKMLGSPRRMTGRARCRLAELTIWSLISRMRRAYLSTSSPHAVRFTPATLRSIRSGADQGFQLLHVRAHRRLGELEQMRRLGEAAELIDGDEGAQQIGRDVDLVARAHDLFARRFRGRAGLPPWTLPLAAWSCA